MGRSASKLIWISKGSHKSRSDLRQININANETDRATLRDLAAQLGLLSLLDEVLAEADEIE